MIEAHRSAKAMARCLVSYIPCDERVRAEVYESWGTKLSLSDIREMRTNRARPALDYGNLERGFDWRGDKLAEEMASTSTRFIQAIERERSL